MCGGRGEAAFAEERINEMPPYRTVHILRTSLRFGRWVFGMDVNYNAFMVGGLCGVWVNAMTQTHTHTHRHDAVGHVAPTLERPIEHA